MVYLAEVVFMNGGRLGSYSTFMELGFTRNRDGEVVLGKSVIFGGLAGVVGAVIASPFFMVKTRLQSKIAQQTAGSTWAGHQHEIQGTWSALVTAYQVEGGILGLWRGVTGAIPRVMVGSAAQLATFSKSMEFVDSFHILPQGVRGAGNDFPDRKNSVLVVMELDGAQSVENNPLKVILSLKKSTVTDVHSSDESSGHKKFKKKKKKKDKKHKHHHKDRSSAEDEIDTAEEGNAADEEGEDTAGEEMEAETLEHSKNESQRCATTLQANDGKEALESKESTKNGRTVFFDFLGYLLTQLEKRDPQQFFAWPVTDAIAPGYSSVIFNPMDFSTMREKIAKRNYDSLLNFKEDFELVCRNAMLYNTADTIYYKAARKLLNAGHKILSREKILELKSEPEVKEIMMKLTSEDVGFEYDPSPPAPPEDMDDTTADTDGTGGMKRPASGDLVPISHTTTKTPRYDPEPDDRKPTREEIMAEAKRVLGEEMGNRLTLRRPSDDAVRPSSSALVKLARQKRDGTTSLAIVTPQSAGGIGNPHLKHIKRTAAGNAMANRRLEKGKKTGSNDPNGTGGGTVPNNLGQLIGKLVSGSGAITGFKEDRRNLLKTVKPLRYGPYSSHGPQFDSSFATTTHEESAILLYGDSMPLGPKDAILPLAVDEDCEFATRLARDLDEAVRAKQKEGVSSTQEVHLALDPTKAMDEANESKLVEDISMVEMDSDIPEHLLGLMSRPVIPVTDLFSKDEGNEEITKGLKETADLLQELTKVQEHRLSLQPPPHLSMIPLPSLYEYETADKVTGKLVSLAKCFAPSTLVSVEAIHKAMGVQRNVDNFRPDSPSMSKHPGNQIQNDVVQSPTEQSRTQADLSQAEVDAAVQAIAAQG
ncbi:unnamed protein product [Cyprideis torosa]|uniref:Uncharacterized protein n=1 Tax=Cyprideis torosa TaxID=163714 RepID=A0A7R8W712_9CRUS|nr:unnamed protein product [Cyprideis torosa]CAG0884673.1 unnamed protein product [Cyprideis torosa]